MTGGVVLAEARPSTRCCSYSIPGAAVGCKRAAFTVTQLSFSPSPFSGALRTPKGAFFTPLLRRPSSSSFLTVIAGRECPPFTGKKTNVANKISESNHKTKRRQLVNLQRKKLWWEEAKHFVTLRLSAKALRNIERFGLDAMAKKAGVNLNRK